MLLSKKISSIKKYCSFKLFFNEPGPFSDPLRSIDGWSPLLLHHSGVNVVLIFLNDPLPQLYPVESHQIILKNKSICRLITLILLYLWQLSNLWQHHSDTGSCTTGWDAGCTTV